MAESYDNVLILANFSQHVCGLLKRAFYFNYISHYKQIISSYKAVALPHYVGLLQLRGFQPIEFLAEVTFPNMLTSFVPKSIYLHGDCVEC
jgi:hypothetical protein